MNDTILCDSIECDDFYKKFLGNGVQKAVADSLTISEQVKKLGEGIELLSQELEKQVLHKHNDLLVQASHATKLESVLDMINTHVQCLFSSAERLRSQIVGPYSILETHTRVLRRLHNASHILRRVNRIQQLSKRLQTTYDPVQQATILQELEQLALDYDLNDIEAVSSELRAARSQRQKVIRLATCSLTQGIATRNVISTSTAIQIFINLGVVKEATNKVMGTAINDCQECMKLSLELPAIAPVSSRNKQGPGWVNVTSTQNYRIKIWTSVEKAFGDEIYMQCKQIQFLQTIMTELNFNQASNNFALAFWDTLNVTLVDEMKKCPTAIQQMFETEYPKILKCYSEMTTKLNYPQYKFNHGMLEKWETSYLSNSVSRLLDPVHSMFLMEVAPLYEQIDSLIRTMTNELSMSLVQENLSEKIAKNVSKCIRMFGVKTEQQLVTGPEVSQVIAGTPNSGQQLNVSLVNALYYLQAQVTRMLANMAESLTAIALNTITESIRGFQPLTNVILEPLVNSINKTIETIIVTIHLEQDWSRLQMGVNKPAACSPYMRELTQFLSRAFHTYLVNFTNQEALSIKCGEIAVRCIELLVRHSALLRPISDGGRQRLQSDYVFLENALKLICPHLMDLGRPYRLLKSVASILTLQPEEIVDSQVVGSSVPHSTVLFLLFSYAGTELVSPHQIATWSITKLSTWLDEHPLESDRLELIAGALQRYVSIIHKKNSTNYDSLYPIIKSLLETTVNKK